MRYDIIEAGLISSTTAQTFPGDALNGKVIVEFILVLIAPAGCIRLHAPLLVETAQVELEKIAALLPGWKPRRKHEAMLSGHHWRNGGKVSSDLDDAVAGDSRSLSSIARGTGGCREHFGHALVPEQGRYRTEH